MFARSLGGVYRDTGGCVATINRTANNAPLPDVHLPMEDICYGLASLHPCKGPGPNGLPPSLLINCASTILLPLTILFNHSLSTCIFPDQ